MTPKILCLSRLHPIKAIDVLIRATAVLAERGVATELILAGPDRVGYAAELQQLAQSLGVADHVHLIGMVRGEQKISLFRACEVFALASKQENFGMVVVEAMAAKLPVVTTKGVDIWPEIERGGVTIVPRTPEHFADAIEPLVGDAAQRSTLGEQGREFVLEWLDRDRVASQYNALYRSAIEPGSAVSQRG